MELTEIFSAALSSAFEPIFTLLSCPFKRRLVTRVTAPPERCVASIVELDEKSVSALEVTAREPFCALSFPPTSTPAVFPEYEKVKPSAGNEPLMTLEA